MVCLKLMKINDDITHAYWNVYFTGDCLTSFEGESVTFGEIFETEAKTKKLAQAPVKAHLQELAAVMQRGNPFQVELPW